MVVSDLFLSTDGHKTKVNTVSGVRYGTDNTTDSIAGRGNISGQIDKC